MQGSKPVRGRSNACESVEPGFCSVPGTTDFGAAESLQNLGFAVDIALSEAHQSTGQAPPGSFGPAIALREMPAGAARKKMPGKALAVRSISNGGSGQRVQPSVREGAEEETGMRSKEKVMPVQAAAIAYAEIPAHKPRRVVSIKPRKAAAQAPEAQPNTGQRKTAQVSSPIEAEATSAASMPAPQQNEVVNSNEVRDRVVLENLSLVKAIAIRVHESLPVHVELDDLVHAGILGLFDAATKFNPYKQVAFSSYAKHRIKGAMLDSLRQLDWASRDMRRRHKQVEQVTRDLYTSLQRNPTDDEVAEKMGVEVERWRQMSIDLRNVGLISASSRPNDQEDLPAPDFPTTTDSHPDSMCAREQLREKLQEAMGVLPERYKKVVVLYYTNELTMKEIGGILGINESRVSQIHKSALEKMANALQSNGITSATAF